MDVVQSGSRALSPTMDPGHCRPGLAMTIEQLDEAKILILDLLGWGVSPEYLIEAGISKECLVPCLRELKLRLPTNIDPSEVAVYDPLGEASSSAAAKQTPSAPQGPAHRLANRGDAHMENAQPSSSPSKWKRKSMAEQRMDIMSTNSAAMEGKTMTVEEQAASLLERLLPPVSAEDDDAQTPAKPPNAKGRRKASNPGGGETAAGFVETPALPLKALKKLARAASASKGANATTPEAQEGGDP